MKIPNKPSKANSYHSYYVQGLKVLQILGCIFGVFNAFNGIGRYFYFSKYFVLDSFSVTIAFTIFYFMLIQGVIVAINLLRGIEYNTRSKSNEDQR